MVCRGEVAANILVDIMARPGFCADASFTGDASPLLSLRHFAAPSALMMLKMERSENLVELLLDFSMELVELLLNLNLKMAQ